MALMLEILVNKNSAVRRRLMKKHSQLIRRRKFNTSVSVGWGQGIFCVHDDPIVEDEYQVSNICKSEIADSDQVRSQSADQELEAIPRPIERIVVQFDGFSTIRRIIGLKPDPSSERRFGDVGAKCEFPDLRLNKQQMSLTSLDNDARIPADLNERH